MLSQTAEPERLRHLYLCQEYSTYEIAGRTGLDRQRVTRVLRKSGVPLRPRGAGRRRALRRAGDPPDLPRLMRNLYEDAKLNSSQVSAILGMPERTVSRAPAPIRHRDPHPGPLQPGRPQDRAG